MRRNVRVLDVRVDAVTKPELHEEIAQCITERARTYLANVNIHAINIAQEDEAFRRFLNASRMVYCDGEGVRWGARILGVRLPPRIVLTYWVWELSEFCEKNNYSMFLLGGKEESVVDAATNLQQRFPHLRIAGYHHGYFEKEGEETDRVIAMVNQAHPDVLLVCFGMPLQEHWVERNLDRLQANVILFGGSTIEYTAGRKSVAPRWMTSCGLEWLYRLFQEPRRLWKRYLIGNPLFMFRVILQRLRSGKTV